MFDYIKSFILCCETCQRTKCNTRPPKAPLTDMFIPNAPMQFISIDIGYLPKDNHGYQYILLIGDIFSKFVQIIPLKDQTAPVIIDALLSSWIFVHGKPLYLLSDQGSNVDGQVMRNICNELGIEKRRSSAYHSQGNGFAERHIRIVKDMLRAVILHRRLPQTSWRQLLPSLVFALNTSLSKANNCIPYNVVFGRSAILPQGVVFGHAVPDPCDHQLAIDYQHTVSSSLNDLFHLVSNTLKLSQLSMQKHYNQNTRFINYSPGDRVWLEKKHYKTGENRKLAPRRDGPWTVTERLPNGVNFLIKNCDGEQKIVHHDRLIPALKYELPENGDVPTTAKDRDNNHVNDRCRLSDRYDLFEEDESDESDYEAEENSSLDSNNEEQEQEEIVERCYPVHNRGTRQLTGVVPWDKISL